MMHVYVRKQWEGEEVRRERKLGGREGCVEGRGKPIRIFRAPVYTVCSHRQNHKVYEL